MHLGTTVPITDSPSAKPASTPLCTTNGVSIAAIPTSEGLWRIQETDPEAGQSRLSETAWYTLQAASRGYSIHVEADTIDFGPWEGRCAACGCWISADENPCRLDYDQSQCGILRLREAA